GAAIAFALGCAIPVRPARASSAAPATFGEVRANSSIWAGWMVAASGLLTQGVVFTFFPGVARGLSPASIGLVFLALGIANTTARVPAGWLMDRTRRSAVYAIGGVLVGCIATALVPHVAGRVPLLALVAAYGLASGTAGVAIGVALAGATTPATRG